jgi:hypothetical protein
MWFPVDVIFAVPILSDLRLKPWHLSLHAVDCRAHLFKNLGSVISVDEGPAKACVPDVESQKMISPLIQSGAKFLHLARLDISLGTHVRDEFNILRAQKKIQLADTLLQAARRLDLLCKAILSIPDDCGDTLK